MNKLLLIISAVILLQGCGHVTIRNSQTVANTVEMYKDTNVWEELHWRIRTIAGQ